MRREPQGRRLNPAALQLGRQSAQLSSCFASAVDRTTAPHVGIRRLAAREASTSCSSRCPSTAGWMNNCTERRISDGSRPISAHASSRLALILAHSSTSPWLGTFHSSAWRAITRSILGFSPPMTIGGCGRCSGLGSTQRVAQGVEAAFEGHRFLGPQSPDDRQRLVQHGHSCSCTGELDSIASVFGLMPSGAEPEVEPATADVVDRHRHLRQHRRIAVGDTCDHATHPRPLHHRGHGGK